MEPIEKLFLRGRAAYMAYLERNRLEEPIGIPSMQVVLSADFTMNPMTCLQFVMSGKSIMILGPNDSVVALLCQHRL